jgi:hypothetical protein
MNSNNNKKNTRREATQRVMAAKHTTLTHKIEIQLHLVKSRDNSVGTALGYGLDDRGSTVRSPAGLGIFPFTTVSRTDLGPTQFPIQWVPGVLSLGVNRPGRETDHSPPSSSDVKECVELYLHSPIRLHGVVLS